MLLSDLPGGGRKNNEEMGKGEREMEAMDMKRRERKGGGGLASEL